MLQEPSVLGQFWGRPPLVEWRLGLPAQLTSAVDRGCRGRKLHFALGRVLVLEHVEGHRTLSILLFLLGKHMTERRSGFRDTATVPVLVVTLRAI